MATTTQGERIAALMTANTIISAIERAFDAGDYDAVVVGMEVLDLLITIGTEGR